jgi:hypothetical protein
MFGKVRNDNLTALENRFDINPKDTVPFLFSKLSSQLPINFFLRFKRNTSKGRRLL